MRIAASQINMSSNRKYLQNGVRSKNANLGTNSFLGLMSKSYDREADGFSNYDKRGKLTDDVKSVGSDSESHGTPEDFTKNLVNYLLSILMKGGAFDIPGFSSGMQGGGFMSGMPVSGSYTQQSVTYHEEESTSFQAEGMALTEDGRQIDFGISLSMSRSFTQYMNVSIPAVQNALLDPLVVNIGSDIASVSDQKFLFDLDANGSKDRISMPTRGSAFLVLDKNDDGTVNDGSELFGALTGDGFGELGSYDSDKNGWIDENDDVFDKLRVWYKDPQGHDVLMNLKDADVGAIYLGEQASEFSIPGAAGDTQAVIRSTGVFLKESGGVGTIQHVDLAVERPGEPAEEGQDYGAYEDTMQINDVSKEEGQAPQRKKNSRIDAEARREKRTERKRQLKEYFEKRREERKELEELFLERSMERHRMYMEMV